MIFNRKLGAVFIISVSILCTNNYSVFGNSKFTNIFNIFDQVTYVDLCGAWEYGNFKHIEITYSWGIGKYTPNVTTFIDLGLDIPRFNIGGVGQIKITKIEKNNHKYTIKLFDEVMKENIIINATIIEKDILIFDKNPALPESGPEYKYHRISGPKIQFLTPKINELSFRAMPSVAGNFIRLLKKGEKLLLLQIGKEEIINNVKGTWVKVLTESSEIGWCFNAYLDEIKLSN